MPKTAIAEVVNKVGETVKVFGWVNTRRDHGKIIFIDLRDRSGILQVVFVPLDKEMYDLATQLRPEFVVSIEGKINQRPEKMVNNKIATGTVELEAQKLEILNPAKTPPFEIDKDTSLVNEEARLKYRYLDLRSERMKKNMIMRHKVIKLIRDYFDTLGFLEVETPVLTKGTPEGAREFIVPARLWPGKFYVLPQSPQQFKQLLMVAGLEKYFQIARCFRDEDQRGDRQAEFTQIDVEMSFVEQEDVFSLVETLMIEIVEKLYPNKKITKKPFPHLTYKETMEKYNSDKPDLRQDKNNTSELAFCWIVDIPMFEYSDTEKKIVAIHHPFTLPNIEDMKKYPDEPLKWRAYAYDLALNGTEIWGGSIRIHRQDIQKKVFELLGLSEEETQRRFGHMLEAFTFGAPPHGGIAAGLDRIVTILQNEPSIREVMAFPKTGDNRDLMMDAPNIVDDKTLREAHVRFADDVVLIQEDETIFNKLQAFLAEKNIEPEVMVHKPVSTSKQAAKVRGTELKQGARAIVFKTEKGFVQVVCSADRKINEGKVKELAGIKELKIASEKEVKEATGCQIGAVPPFGNLFDLPVYVDKSLAQNEFIAFNAGMNTRSIKMKYADWEKVVKPKVGELS